jgi:hypothetical protein
MTKDVVYIVGDKFQQFANKPNVMTITELERLASCAAIGKLSDCEFRIGQGVALSRLTRIREKMKRNFGSLQGDFLAQQQSLVKEELRWVHKHKVENNMLSQIVKLTDDRYVCQLLLDNDSVLLSDHITGEHLQGMVLQEAARQMMLATTERFCIAKEHQGKMYFVLNELSTCFHAFTFPLSVEMELRFVDKVAKPKGGLKANIVVSFSQNGALVTEVLIQYAVYQKAFLILKERNLSAEALVTARQQSIQNSVNQCVEL